MEEKDKIIDEKGNVNIDECDEATNLTIAILDEASNMEPDERKQFIESLIVNEDVKVSFIGCCLDILKIYNDIVNGFRKIGSSFFFDIIKEKLNYESNIILEVISIAKAAGTGLTHEDLVNGMQSKNMDFGSKVNFNYNAELKNPNTNGANGKKPVVKNLSKKPSRNSKVKENCGNAAFQRLP